MGFNTAFKVLSISLITCVKTLNVPGLSGQKFGTGTFWGGDVTGNAIRSSVGGSKRQVVGVCKYLHCVRLC